MIWSKQPLKPIDTYFLDLALDQLRIRLQKTNFCFDP